MKDQHTPASARPARRHSARLAAAGVVAAGLVLAAPIAATAHVGVTPDEAAAGASSVLTFSFSHGCDDSSTTALVFEIPEGVQSVYPTLTPGWSIATEQGDNGSITQVAYTADDPVPSGIRATIDLSVRFTEEVANTSVAFPVTQVCETGETAWVEVAEDGADAETLESPAPVVAVGAVSSEDDHAHGGATTDATDGASDDDHADHEGGAGEQPASSADALPVVLGSIGLGLGAIALVVAVLAYRRTRTRTRTGA